MKKILYLLISISILLSSTLVSASVISTTNGFFYTNINYVKTVLVSQNPISANPGEYVELLFQVENKGANDAENVTLELIPEYPFSLDPGVSATQEIGTIKGLQNSNNVFSVKYKLKVDKDAIDGENEIKLKYSEGDGSVYNVDTFNVSVLNSRTDFDVFAQDSTTIAIANTGANTASAVIVRIPEQQNFRVNGTSASIIGNLNAGDYTLVTFQLLSVRTSNISSEPSILTAEISYTDTLGIRRTIQKNVSYGFSVSGFNENVTGRFTQRGQSSILSGNSLLYIGIGAVGIIAIVVVIKVKTRKKK
jgi:hypothetical protein